MLNTIRSKRGSALLVAMLVMGVLLSVSLALSTLVLRELRITKDLLNSGKAFYAAESGMEVALFELNNSLPGWEPGTDRAGNDKYVPLEVGDDAVAEFKVDNRCQTYPCFEDFDLDSISAYNGNLHQIYGILNLNETVTIPLFIYDEDADNGIMDIGGFTVEFFANFNPKTDFIAKKEDGTGFNSWEVLRWKIYGLRTTLEGVVTESINDKAAVQTVNYVESDSGEKFYNSTNAKQPSWFGTHNCTTEVDNQDASRINLDIDCVGEQVTNEVIEKIDGQQAKIFSGVCDYRDAREFYDYASAIGGKLEFEDIKHCYKIASFLDNHDNNYLSLTNMMNPSLFDFAKDGFGTKEERLKKSQIFYRVEFYEEGAGTTNEVVRDYANITSHGYSGNAKQSISVKMKKGSIMPVFNFAIYSTKEVD